MGFAKFAVPFSVVGTLACGAILTKDYMSGARYKGEERMAGRTVIVTGANTGLGRETTKDLARRGARIIMACRDMEKCDKACKEIMMETANMQIQCRKLDLASMASIRAFAKLVKSTEKHIDVLINNAGIMNCPKMLTEDGLEMQMGVNHFGHFLLTQLLVEKLRTSATESTPSRIIFLSSLAHVRGEINFKDLNSNESYQTREVYSMSKLANILCANELAERLEGANVTVNSLHPGIVATELGRHMSVVNSTFGQISLFPIKWLFMKTPAQGAQTSIRLACDPSLNKVSGKYFSDCEEKTPSPQALDDAVGKRLWAISEAWTRSKME